MTIFDEIKQANKYHFELNNFWDILKNNKKELIKKIIITNCYKRFDFNFENNEEYFEKLYFFIEKNIFSNNKLTIQNYRKLYEMIFNPFFKEKDLWFRKENITAIIWWKVWKDTYSNAENIIKELEVILSKYNNPNIELFEKLYIITMETLSKTHPFNNNNFLFISIFLDLLLIKNWFLPIWLKKTFKDNNLFLPNKETFYKIILLRYKKYSY